MDISVVVPLYNEEESLPELFAWIERVMNANGFSYEVIFVNDGSTDHSWEVIEKLKAQSEQLRTRYGALSSAATTGSRRHCSVVSNKHKATS